MALVRGVRQDIVQRYWNASRAWKGRADHPSITNYEELIDELCILRTQQWRVGHFAALMMQDVVEDVRHRRLPTAAQIYRFGDGKKVVLYTSSGIDEPKSMVN